MTLEQVKDYFGPLREGHYIPDRSIRTRKDMFNKHPISSHCSSQKGFSLLELVVTVFIAGIMAAIAIPNFMNWLPNIRLKSAARDLFSNMQSVRMEAIKTNTDWAIVFDTAGNQYFVCSAPGGDDDWATIGDNTISSTVVLTDYKSGIQYGHGNLIDDDGNATKTAGAFPADDVSFTSKVAIFNNKGTGNSGYVYLDHLANEPDPPGSEDDQPKIAYAVGARSSGSIKLKRWTGSTWE